MAALTAVLVSGKGRSFAPRKPRGREPVDAATPTRPDDAVDANAWAFRTRDRKMPPGVEFYYDPNVMRRFQLSELDEQYITFAPSEEAAARYLRSLLP